MKRSYKVDKITRNIVEAVLDPKDSLSTDGLVKWWGFKLKARKLLYPFPPRRYGKFC